MITKQTGFQFSFFSLEPQEQKDHFSIYDGIHRIEQKLPRLVLGDTKVKFSDAGTGVAVSYQVDLRERPFAAQ